MKDPYRELSRLIKLNKETAKFVEQEKKRHKLQQIKQKIIQLTDLQLELEREQCGTFPKKCTKPQKLQEYLKWSRSQIEETVSLIKKNPNLYTPPRKDVISMFFKLFE